MDTENKTTIEIGTIIKQNILLLNGLKRIKLWKVGKILYKKKYSITYEFFDETKNCFACKILKKSKIYREDLKVKLINEIKLQKSLIHTNICKLYNTFDDELNIYIILEYCPNQTLHQMLKRRKYLHEIEVQCFSK